MSPGDEIWAAAGQRDLASDVALLTGVLHDVVRASDGEEAVRLLDGAVALGRQARGGDEIAADRIQMTVAKARVLGEAAMRGAGYDDDDARILTDHVLDAALCGYEYSGLPKLLNVVDYPDFRLPRRPITVV